MKIGSIIRKHRRAKGKTLKEIAFKSGIGEAFLSLVERDYRKVSLDRLQKIVDALDLPLYQLFIDYENEIVNNDDLTLSKTIRKLRKEKKLSLRKAAKECGIANTYLWQLEKGEFSNPTLDIIRKLSEGLSLTIVIEKGKIEIFKNIIQRVKI